MRLARASAFALAVASTALPAAAEVQAGSITWDYFWHDNDADHRLSARTALICDATGAVSSPCPNSPQGQWTLSARFRYQDNCADDTAVGGRVIVKLRVLHLDGSQTKVTKKIRAKFGPLDGSGYQTALVPLTTFESPELAPGDRLVAKLKYKGGSGRLVRCDSYEERVTLFNPDL